jgi:hypothetical protein
MTFEQLRQSSKLHLARMAGFYLSVVAFLFMWLMIFGAGMTGGFRVWFADPSLIDIHVVHDVTFFYMIWVFGLAMLVQLYKPKNRITTMQLALLIPIVALLDIVPQIIQGTFSPMILVFFAPVFIAAALHPSRDEVFSREQLSMDTLNRPLLGLAVIALVPVGLYALGQLNLQLTLTDEHAAVSHYSSMAFFSLLFVVYAALASLGGQHRRAAAYGAAFLASILAAISTVEPAASAISPLWSGAAVLWALAVVGTYEWSARRTNAVRDDLTMEERVTVD